MKITMHTAFNLGDRVWTLFNMKIVSTTIIGIQVSNYVTKQFPYGREESRTSYTTADGITHGESQLFHSREELIQSL